MSIATKALALDETLQKVVDELQRLTSVSVTADIGDLHDVNIATPANGDILQYNSLNQTWENKTLPSGLHTYSTTEQRVGTWIDNKPVYEQVFALSSRTILPSQVWTSISDVPITNIKGIIDAVAYDNSAASNTKMTAVNIYMTDCSDATHLRVWNTRNSDVGITHIKLQYIKIND